ncbi:MAG: TetR/AcrR family transcriptional regulator [Pseudomonadota bacterium]
MTSREENRAKAISDIADHLIKEGLAKTSLRQLAEAAGVSDRMLLYYFENKDDVMLAALSHLAGQLTAKLDTIPEDPLSPAELFDQAAKMIDEDGVRPFMNLWIEATAAAVRDIAPYPMIASALSAGFLDWMKTRLAEPEDGSQTRAAQAAMLMAIIDGLEIVRICAGEEAYKQARQSSYLALRTDRNGI